MARIIKISIFISIILLNHWDCIGQNKVEDKIVQLTGLILTGDSLRAVPYATIYNKRSHRGTISDFRGFFSFVAHKGDTIRFSCIGFKEVKYKVPDTLSSNRYSMVQLMTHDTIYLSETIIYPWPTREQFKVAFLNTEVPEDDYDRAMRNLERAELKERLMQMPMDGGHNFKNYMNQYNSKLYYKGQSPPLNIFNPFAWAKFIEAWKEGKFKRQD